MAIMLLYPVCRVGAEPLRMVYNPFTGKMDYVTQLTSNTLPGGSTQYLGSIHVLDENVLQGNATSFNFTGTGVTCVLSGKVLTCTIPGGGVGGEPSFALFTTTGEPKIEASGGFLLFRSTGQQKIEDAGGFVLFRSTGENGVREGAGFRLFQSTGELGIREGAGFRLFQSTGESGIREAAGFRLFNSTLPANLLTVGSMSVVGSIITTSTIYGREATFYTMSVIGTITSTSGFIGPVSSITAQSVNPQALQSDDDPANGEVPKWNSATNKIAWSSDNDSGASSTASSATVSNLFFTDEATPLGPGSSVTFTGPGVTASQAGGVTTINVPGGGSLDPTAPITVGSMTSVGSITTTGTVISSQLNISTITFNRTLNTKNALPNKQDFSAGWQWVGSSYSSTAISTITVDMTGSTYAAYRFIFTTTATTPGTGRDVMMTFNGDFEKREARRYASSRRTLATLTSSSAARGILLMNISTTSNISVDATVLANPLNAPKVGKYDVTTMPERFWGIPVSSNTGIPTIIDGRFSWNDFTQQISSVSFSCIGGGITGGFFGPPVSLKVFGATEVVP